MFDLLNSLMGDAALTGEFGAIVAVGVVIAMSILTAFPIMYLCDIVAGVVKRLFRIKD